MLPPAASCLFGAGGSSMVCALRLLLCCLINALESTRRGGGGREGREDATRAGRPGRKSDCGGEGRGGSLCRHSSMTQCMARTVKCLGLLLKACVAKGLLECNAIDQERVPQATSDHLAEAGRRAVHCVVQQAERAGHMSLPTGHALPHHAIEAADPTSIPGHPMQCCKRML